MIQNIVAVTMNDILEDASSWQMKTMKEPTMKVKDAVSAFEARVEILNFPNEIKRDLLLWKRIYSVFLIKKTTDKERRKLEGSDVTMFDTLAFIHDNASGSDLEKKWKKRNKGHQNDMNAIPKFLWFSLEYWLFAFHHSCEPYQTAFFGIEIIMSIWRGLCTQIKCKVWFQVELALQSNWVEVHKYFRHYTQIGFKIPNEMRS